MARLKIPHLTYRQRADGTRRHFWQPSAALRRKGFLLKRLSNGPKTVRAEAMLMTHRSAAYAEWLASEIAAAIDDPRPSVSQEKMMARLDAKLAARRMP